MGQVGFQDYWVVGSRVYFKPDDVGGVKQPWLDFGTLQVASPTLTPDQVELEDPDGGMMTSVAQAVTQIDETYEITTSNLNLDMLSMLFMASLPEAFTQTAGQKNVQHWAIPARLLKLHDDDADSTLVYGLDSIFGVYEAGDRITTTQNDITAMNRNARTIVTATDLSANIAATEQIIVHRDGLANAANARTYTVSASAANLITVEEEIVADEAAVTVDITYLGSGSTGAIYSQKKPGSTETGKDWEVVSEERGLLHFIDGATNPTVAKNVQVLYHKAALTGQRLFKPHSTKGTINGKLVLVYGRNTGSEQSVRECRVSLTPGNTALSDTDYSNITLNCKVISDLTATDPAGRFVQFNGAVVPRS